MTLTARLNLGESLGDRVMKVNHAGEHGAVCIYRGQRWVASIVAPALIDELHAFQSHEERHRGHPELHVLRCLALNSAS